MIEFGKLEYYLLVVNAIGALAYLINLLLYRHTANGRIDVIVTMVSLLGGSAGMLLMILLFDRKAEKRKYDVSGVYYMHFHYSGDYAVDFQRTSCRAFYICILEVLCRTPDIADISWDHESCDIYRICD